MSIVLRDGTVLPDLPEGVITEEYPYAVIFISNLDIYYIIPTNEPYIFAPAELGGPFTTCIGEAQAMYSTIPISANWTLDNANPSQPLIPDGRLKWSNHDIYTITSLDENEMPIIGTEIYFPSSLANPPFVLPDGTKLPPPPDGCFDDTPYGVILNIVWKDGDSGEILHSSYALGLLQRQFSALPTSMVPDIEGVTPDGTATHHLVTPLGRAKTYTLNPESNAWELLDEGECTKPVVSYGMNVVSWSNHDFCEITELNADDMSYTVGSTIVRKSDVNYRITEGWVRSIANETRRLGNISDGLTTDEMGEALRNIELSSGSVIDLPNVMEVSF